MARASGSELVSDTIQAPTSKKAARRGISRIVFESSWTLTNKKLVANIAGSSETMTLTSFEASSSTRTFLRAVQGPKMPTSNSFGFASRDTYFFRVQGPTTMGIHRNLRRNVKSVETRKSSARMRSKFVTEMSQT